MNVVDTTLQMLSTLPLSRTVPFLFCGITSWAVLLTELLLLILASNVAMATAQCTVGRRAPPVGVSLSVLQLLLLCVHTLDAQGQGKSWGLPGWRLVLNKPPNEPFPMVLGVCLCAFASVFAYPQKRNFSLAFPFHLMWNILINMNLDNVTVLLSWHLVHSSSDPPPGEVWHAVIGCVPTWLPCGLVAGFGSRLNLHLPGRQGALCCPSPPLTPTSPCGQSYL